MSRDPVAYGSYRELVATPEDHVAFLRVVAEHINGDDDATMLYRRLGAAVKVAGKPFSQASHMLALETIPDATQLELIQLSRAIHDADPGYNVPFFTVGMEYMRRQLHERGIDADRHAGPVAGLEP
ncbi:hypothetical protein WH212_09560 [Xanthomonas perforans]|uniref:Uncharacterized protein n=1 Tax=Xanthomonas euvesicatoria TaxID=456327 RepID=A0AAX4FRJ6_XANEU|nr:hypothetical protein [Xanthomonas euvesicatoria]WOP59080.1 hypothetical protein R5577_22765 [Xanthomonas euvesicatoria]